MACTVVQTTVGAFDNCRYSGQTVGALDNCRYSQQLEVLSTTVGAPGNWRSHDALQKLWCEN